MGKTPIYQLGYLEAGQSDYDLDLDERRFRAIENQTYALYELFGNGILDDDPDNPSWRIDSVPSSTSQISITAGRGHVAWKYAETNSAATLNLPTPPGGASVVTYWVYAVANEDTAVTREVDFIVSLVELLETDVYVGLGGVVVDFSVDPVSIAIYNTAEYGRVNISLFSTLASIINKHRHIGGSRNPSPIDLGRHVQGKLSGDKIENLDLNTVTKGFLSAERLPLIDHNILLNRGTLTHAEIDTLLGMLNGLGEGYRLSDISLANRLQVILALKRQAGLDAIDEMQLNAVFYIPGITTSSFEATGIPETITLADIDYVNHQIVGTTVTPVRSSQIVWTTDTDFDAAYAAGLARTVATDPATENIEVIGEGTNGSITIARPTNYRGIATTDLTSPNWQDGYVFLDQSTKNTVSPPPTTHEYHDEYDVERYFWLPFTAQQNWAGQTHIGVGYGLSVESVPGTIYMYLVLANGGTAVTVSKDGSETTIRISTPIALHPSDFSGNIEEVYAVREIAEFGLSAAQRVAIKGVGFSWSTAGGWNGQELDFYLRVPDESEISTVTAPYPRVIEARQTLPDTSSAIFIWNESLYAPLARLVFRFDSNYTTTMYNQVNWSATIPGGSRLRFYTRTADIQGNLGTAYIVSPITHLIDSNSRYGRWVDVIAELYASTDLASAPTVDSITLSFDSPGAAANKTWNKRETDLATGQTGWLEGISLENLTIGPNVSDGGLTKNYLAITDTSRIGQFVYLRSNNLYASYSLDGSDESVYVDTSQAGAITPYVTPVQGWNGSVSFGLNAPRDMSMLSDDTVVFADTKNDRLVQFDSDGVVLRIIQGNIRLSQANRDFVALSAAYNPRLGQLWIAFSQNVTAKDWAKISLISDQSYIALSDVGVTPNLFDPINGKTATLTATFSTKLKNLINSWSSRLQLVLSEGAVQCEGASASGGGTGGGGIGTGGGGTGGGGGGGGTGGFKYSDQSEVVGSGSLLGDFSLITTAQSSTGGSGGSTLSRDVDFNGDNAITNSTTATLLGPNAQAGRVVLNVYRGEVVYDNILGPVSIQAKSDGTWIMANPHTDAVIAYDDQTNRLWTIPSTVAPYIDGRGGSAYQMDNDNVLLALPADSRGQGTLAIVNLDAGNVVITTINVVGDVVRALPDADSIIDYWALIDDTVNADGRNSKLLRYDTRGNVSWSATSALRVYHPQGLRLLSNGDIILSE